MKKWIMLSGLILAILVIGCETLSDSPLSSELDQENIVIPPDVTGKYIVTVSNKSGLSLGKVQATSSVTSVLSTFNISDEAVKHSYSYVLVGFTATLDEDQVEQLTKAGYRVEPDQIVRMFQGKGKGKGGGSDPQETPWGISRIGGPLDGTGKTAWIIDTGIDLDHPDLNVDVARSVTFITRGPDSKSADDGNGHGTHVAGTVAALDNDIDVVGVAAGATVVAVKVLDRKGSGTYSGVIAGIDYVAQYASPGDGANMSLGGGISNSLDDAVRNAADAGIMFALAAGNDGDDANNYSPARVEYNNVWTVSASDINDAMPSWSNWSGPTLPPVEFAAPGRDILSLWKDGGKNTISGTSMASPHVLGVLLMTSGSPNSDGLVSDDPDGEPDPIVHL